MDGPYDAEVASVQGRNLREIQPFCERDHSCVGGTQGEVRVLVDKLGRPAVVGGRQVNGRKGPGCQRA